MFHRKLRLAILFGLVWSVSWGAWAAPRVALLTPDKGSILLGGLSLTAPTLLEEGQQLQLGEGAVATVTVLGSRAEAELKGPLNLTVSRAALERLAKPLPQRRLAVTNDIGNSSRPAALVQRVARTPDASDRAEEDGAQLTLVVSPVAWDEDQGELSFTLRAREDRTFPYQGEQGYQVFIYSWSETAATGPGPRYRQLPDWPHNFQQDFQEVEVRQLLGLFSEAAQPGRRYLINVIHEKSDQLVGSRRYRHLTAGEKEALVELDRELRSSSDETKSVEPLFTLARLYNELDQLEKALEVLLLAKSSPYFATAELTPEESADLDQEIEALRRLLPEDWSRPHEPRGGSAS